MTHPNAIGKDGEPGFLWQKAVTSKVGALFSDAVLERVIDHLPAKNVPNPIEFREAMEKACDDVCAIRKKSEPPRLSHSAVANSWREKLLDKKNAELLKQLSDDDRKKLVTLRGHEYSSFVLSKLNLTVTAKRLGLR